MNPDNMKSTLKHTAIAIAVLSLAGCRQESVTWFCEQIDSVPATIIPDIEVQTR